MKTKVYNTLGINVPFQVPESVEEFNENAKNADACLTEATNNVIYRSTLAQFRSVFLHGWEDVEAGINIKGVEQVTGVERNGEKDDKGEIKEYTESEAKYFARVCAQLGKEPTSFQDLANQVAAALPFDASSTPRTPAAPKKTAKAYLDAADQVIASGKADAVAAALGRILGSEVKADRESLGKAISLHEAKKRAEEQKKLAGQYVAMVEA